MTDTIKIRPAAFDAGARLLRRDLDSYCAFRLKGLSGVLPGRGFADHDQRIRAAGLAAVSSYRQMLESDARAVTATGLAFSAVDTAVSAAIREG